MSSTATSTAETSVNYEGTPLLELTLEEQEQDFRIDSGKQGTSLSISTRPSGTWDWSLVGEARWDGSMLRCRALERPVLLLLSAAFKQALADLE